MVITRLFSFPWWRRERRAHARIHLPALVLVIGRNRYPALDWSLGGCRIEVESGESKLGDRIEGTLVLDGHRERGEFLAEVMRAGDGGDLGLRWLEISGSLFAAMAQVKIR
jgi:hypothetical protein